MRPLIAADSDRCCHHQHPAGSIERGCRKRLSSMSTSSMLPPGHEAFTVAAPPKNARAWHLVEDDGQDHRRSMNPTTQAFNQTRNLRLGTTPGMAAHQMTSQAAAEPPGDSVRRCSNRERRRHHYTRSKEEDKGETSPFSVLGRDLLLWLILFGPWLENGLKSHVNYKVVKKRLTGP